MKPNPYVGKSLWAFDTETWLIAPGLLAPPVVCGSWAREYTRAEEMAANGGAPRAREGILTKAEALAEFRRCLLNHDVLTGHNLAYDVGVMCAADPTLLPLVIAKYERDEVFDTMVAEQLLRIHSGTLKAGSSKSGGGLSLEDLGRQYLDVDRSAEKHAPDAWRLRYAELDGVPLDQWPEAAIAYPIRDARFTYDIAALQIEDGRNLHDLPAQCRAHLVLHFSAMWGMRTDRPWVEAFTRQVTTEHHRTRARFLAEGLLKVRRCQKKDGVREQADDIDEEALRQAIKLRPEGDELRVALEKALADVLEGERPMRYAGDQASLKAVVTDAYQGDPPVSKKGNVRCNKDTLWESGNELLSDFADAQENEKFFSTYLPVLARGVEVPINPRVNVLVETGRTSYGAPNLQNLPRGGDAGNPREGFVARDGTVFCSCDYPTLELRTLAFALEALGFESEMARLLRVPVQNADGSVTIGIDLHAKLAAQIRGCTYDEFMAALEAGEKWAKDYRQMSKAGNFGLPGGLGATKLVTYARQSYNARFCLLSGRAEKCGVELYYDKRAKVNVCKTCREVAVEIKEAWFAMLPEMSSDDGYFALVAEWTSREVIEVEDEDGEVQDMEVGSVTQLVSERIRGRCNFTNGANTIFQGLAADVAKRSLWLVFREAYGDPTSPLWGSRLVVFVHDEQFLELLIANASAAARRVCALMEQAFHEYCPSIPCKVEPALAFRWYKGAETKTDASGNVVPMEHCLECEKLVPVGWDGVALKHKYPSKLKDGETPHPKAGRVCDGVGKPNEAVVARLSQGAVKRAA
jgi:DNA polymerase-1